MSNGLPKPINDLLSGMGHATQCAISDLIEALASHGLPDDWDHIHAHDYLHGFVEEATALITDPDTYTEARRLGQLQRRHRRRATESRTMQ